MSGPDAQLAIYVSSGISGGHINPAVTIALALFRKFHWRKVPGYVFSQLLGGFFGAGIIYGTIVSETVRKAFELTGWCQGCTTFHSTRWQTSTGY